MIINHFITKMLIFLRNILKKQFLIYLINIIPFMINILFITFNLSYKYKLLSIGILEI